MKVHELLKTIESRLKLLADETEKASVSEEIQGYLQAMSRFHNYSWQNTLSIYTHCPHATQVAGFVAWKKLGRYVKRGEQGIPILAPCTARKQQGCNAEIDDEAQMLTYFKVVYVFDVSQTEGEPLPEAPITTSGSDQGLLSVLEQIASNHSIQLEYKALAGSHHGTSFGGRIEIDARLEPAGKASVLVHELAHEFLHKNDDRDTLSRQQMELEAEATAFVVCSHFGINTASPNYLALWDVAPEEIMDSLQRIHALAVQLIQEIDQISIAPSDV